MTLLWASPDVAVAINRGMGVHSTEYTILAHAHHVTDEDKEIEARSYCPHGHLLKHHHGAQPGDSCYRPPLFGEVEVDVP